MLPAYSELVLCLCNINNFYETVRTLATRDSFLLAPTSRAGSESGYESAASTGSVRSVRSD